MTLSTGPDGFYHPSNENDVVELINAARAENKAIRTCGASHSQSWAIFTDSLTPEPNIVNRETPPPTTGYNLILDSMMSVELIDAENMLVRAQAGVHLGYDPSDVTGKSTLENSLLYQLWYDYGLTVSELGGITHQTLGGFLSTGSAGGSLKYSFQDNIVGIQFVDGKGIIHNVSRDDEDPSIFFAAMTSMGLLGVITSVVLKCEPAFNVVGQEATVTYDECEFDFFGESSTKPSLSDFFKDIDYGRVNWWPQPGVNRLLPWQAQRIKPVVGFTPSPYQEFTNYPDAAEPVISIIYAVIGNLDAPELIPEKVEAAKLDLIAIADLLIEETFGPLGRILKAYINMLLSKEFDKAIAYIQKHTPEIKENLPALMVEILNVFQPLDSDKKGMSKGNPQVFQDHAPWGLPMDNQASDELLSIEFSELWFPIDRTEEVMQTLRDYFDAAQTDEERLKRTGLFTIEVYMAKACEAWLAMGYTNGEDEWKNGAVRFEPLWFVDFFENPAEEFYPQFWNLFREKNIPFRLHWGKMLPDIMKGDPSGWAEYTRQKYPKWDDFMTLRAQLDPQQIFVTDYWRRHLMISPV